MLKLNKGMKYYNYSVDSYIRYEVIESKAMYDVYIYHVDYGIKLFIVGMPKETTSFDDVLACMIKNSVRDTRLLYDIMGRIERG